MMRVLSLAAVAAGIVLFAFPTASDSCAIAPPVPVFATARRPGDVGEFARGKIGVIRASYRRQYLIGAYRTLTGKPLSQPEAGALYGGPKPGPAPSIAPAAVTWGEVRKKAGATGFAYINTFKNTTSKGLVVYYPNCLEGAFESAVKTFQQRAAQWGDNDPRLREWVAAQDQVFANCSGENPVIPEAPAPGMDPLLASDRRYQIAAAYFYAEDWQKARDAFQEVAQDAASPWKGIAPYLIARAHIREGTVNDDPDALQQAEQRLQAIVDDPAQQAWHEPSRKLLELVRLRIDPKPRLAELGAELSGVRPAADLAQASADFLYLYRRMIDNAQSAAPGLAASSDLADWMQALEGHDTKASGAHALEQWKKTHSAAWLIPALMYGQDPEAIRAARGTDPNAPEYEAVTYYGMLADPNPEDAQGWADEALSRQLLLSTRNLILEQRLRYARDWSEFLRFAPRQPEPKLQSFDGDEEDAEKPPVPTGTAALLDSDAAGALNRNIPFSLWEDAAGNSLLPEQVQLQTAEAAWVRALVLGKDAEAHDLMQRMVQLQPAFAAPARDVLTASDADAARFAGVLLLLRTPGLRAFVDPGEAPADLNKTSDLGAISWGFAAGCLPYDFTRPRPASAFLSAAQQAANAAEWKQMEATAPTGGGYLADQVLAWARSHPDDPRVPEALHLVVQAGRRTCRPLQEQVTYGRTAFELLHRRYPNSEWTEKTKYWYQ